MSSLVSNSRICIVGAGPAGITAAIEYKKLGYQNIVMLEREDRVGGRCVTTAEGNDLGAVVWCPGAHDEFNEFTDQLGIEREWVPPLTKFSAATGKIVPAPRLFEQCLIYWEAIRYLWYWRKWRGVAEPGFGKVSEALSEPWSQFVRRMNLERFSRHVAVPLRGFGYRDLAAVYGARYVSPGPMLGSIKARILGGESLGIWKGGTQKIWEKAVASNDLDVRLSAQISAIHRQESVKVFLDGQAEPLEFDFLVLACNPKSALSLLDADEREEALFSQFRTLDYRAYECRVSGLYEGRTLYGAFEDNLDESGFDRPAVFYKRRADSDLFVVWLNAATANENVIFNNLCEDFASLGGELEQICNHEHFSAFSPHVDPEAIANGFFESLQQWQGSRHTMGVGAAFTFDIMPQVMRQARAMVQAHVLGTLSPAN